MHLRSQIGALKIAGSQGLLVRYRTEIQSEANMAGVAPEIQEVDLWPPLAHAHALAWVYTQHIHTHTKKDIKDVHPQMIDCEDMERGWLVMHKLRRKATYRSQTHCCPLWS